MENEMNRAEVLEAQPDWNFQIDKQNAKLRRLRNVLDVCIDYLEHDGAVKSYWREALGELVMVESTLVKYIDILTRRANGTE